MNAPEDVEALRDEVARTVMGWHRVEMAWAYDGTAMLWHDREQLPRLTVHAWQPERDDGQNMQVVQRMLELGFSLRMQCTREACQVSFRRGAAGGPETRDRDRRRAVLLAALAALRATGDG
jgi:hypothetical protein